MVINQDPIKPEEVIFDVDNFPTLLGNVWEFFVYLMSDLTSKGYSWELWHAQGMRSPHLYVFIPELKLMNPAEREEYKKIFLQKYCPQADLNMAQEGHLISAKNKPHFKYGFVKRKLLEEKDA